MFLELSSDTFDAEKAAYLYSTQVKQRDLSGLGLYRWVAGLVVEKANSTVSTALRDPNRFVVVQVAPAVRAALDENL